MAQNTFNNNILDGFNIPRTIIHAVQKASAATGVNFSYLMEKAAVESGFNPDAKAKTSSATGLFQFIESTWLHMIREHGDKYGLGKFADKIDDHNRVSDSKTRREILNMRKDPEIASLMAAELVNSNMDHLQKHVGGKIGQTELYMAHFLGAGGASDFLNAMKKSPNMIAADLFPREARANRNVFYEPKTGAPRSLQEIYAMFDKKFDHSNTSVVAANPARTMPVAESTPILTHAIPMEDPFIRLSTLMQGIQMQHTQSMLRIMGDAGEEKQTQSPQSFETSLQIVPPSMYGKLSLSPAQMMMLSDFA